MNIQHNVDLTYFNTLALPSLCSDYLLLDDATTIDTLLPQATEYAKAHQLPLIVLSGGSNVLMPKQLNALVLHMATRGEQVVADSAQSVVLKVAAGEVWHDFVCACTARGYYGLENLALIPGKVGAAPIQNIGAYGLEVGSVIEQIWAYDVELAQSVKLSAAQCGFAYRDSIFKQQSGRYIITAVSFRLTKQPNMQLSYADVAQQVGQDATPERLLQTIITIRQQKLPDPRQFPNVGSFFKNPLVSREQCQQLLGQFPRLPHYVQPSGDYKLAAGWLIEQAGWKGKRLGAVGMFERQALVLVNYGDADLDDIKATYQHVQIDVWQKFQVQLEPEPVSLELLTAGA